MKRIRPNPIIAHSLRLMGISIALIFLILSACNSDDNEPPSTGITGEWLLVEMLADPGDGSGIFVPVDSEKRITISAGGTYSSNGDVCSFTSEVTTATNGSYSEDNDSYIIECSNMFPGFVRINLDDDHLIISFPCIEPCQQKFRRID